MSELSTEANHTHDAKAAHPALRMAAPLVALGASWAASKALSGAYRAITGDEPPVAEDRSVSLTRVLTWTIVTAATGAVIQMAVYRFASRALPDGN